MSVLLQVDEARDRILAGVRPLPPIEVPLLEAHGCVLADDVGAAADVPAFSVAEADGFAVRSGDVQSAGPAAPVTLRLVGWASPGRVPQSTVGWGETVRVSPGAAVPAGADAIATLEECELEVDLVHVRAAASPGAGVRPPGREVHAGEALVPAGRRLFGPELAVLAAAGFSRALAHPRVRVAVMAVGELAEPGQPAAFGQLTDAVSYAACGAVRDADAVPYRVGIVHGAPEEIREAMISDLARADAFLVVGEVSPTWDAESVLGGLGKVERVDVAMRPRPVVEAGTVEGMPYLGLFGSAAAVVVGFEALIRPAILRLMARGDLRRPEVRARLQQETARDPESETLHPVRAERGEEGWVARPAGDPDAGELAALASSNGLAVLPPGDEPLPAGEAVAVRSFRPSGR